MCALLLATSCSVRLADFNAISTRNVNLDLIDLDSVPSKKVVGSSTRFIFLCIPFGLPTLEEAVDDALDAGGGDLMTDTAVYRTGWWFLVGTTSIEVRGSVVDTTKAKRGGS
jgi:hypothetical protein